MVEKSTDLSWKHNFAPAKEVETPLGGNSPAQEMCYENGGLWMVCVCVCMYGQCIYIFSWFKYVYFESDYECYHH